MTLNALIVVTMGCAAQAAMTVTTQPVTQAGRPPSMAAPTAPSIPPTATPPPRQTRRPGETWTRRSAGATMVYVTAGEFLQGSEEAAVEYARDLCKHYSGDLILVPCIYETYRDEQPAQTTALDTFWIDRAEVTNGHYHGYVQAGGCTVPEESGSYTRKT